MLRATRCAELGRGGNIPAGFQFETALQMHAWQDLAGIGAPVRVFLLSDLLHKDFPIADIRLAVFLNAFMLSDELRRAVKTKVQTDGRTVAWIFAPGLLDADACTDGPCTPNASMASELVGLPLAMHVAEAPMETKFVSQTTSSAPAITPPLAGSSYGHALGTVAPRLSCVDENSSSDEPLVVLGRYTQGSNDTNISKVAICCRSSASTASNYKAVFIGAPRPPLLFWRSLAKSAGVFLYTDGTSTDDVATNRYADTVEVCVGPRLKQYRVAFDCICCLSSQYSLMIDSLSDLSGNIH
jgi:hypothetical protein